MKIMKKNGTEIEIKDEVYTAILEQLSSFPFKDEYVTYGKIFSTIKPKLVEVLGEAVWYVSAVVEQLVITGKISEMRDNETSLYKIESKEL
ncbi:hypothetical protein AwErysi_07390 [Erysipelotrichaceae bacterium]|nr:hypothetical protein AwErysi_07390 [Erysipelotrichaceae bacterium]